MKLLSTESLLSILVRDYILKNINFKPIDISIYKYSKIYKKVIIFYQYKEKKYYFNITYNLNIFRLR